MADLEAVAAAALGSPLIAGLTGGRFGEVATYLPGRRLQGVREVDGMIEVHVVAKWGRPLPEVAEVVRAAVAPTRGTLRSPSSWTTSRCPRRPALEPHDVLGVTPGAPRPEVAEAFRRFALQNHPDRGGDPARFQEGVEAYRRLTGSRPARLARADVVFHRRSRPGVPSLLRLARRRLAALRSRS